MLVDRIIQSIELFVPHLNLQKITWTTDFIELKEADIIGVPKELIRHYPKDTAIINVDKKKVERGKPCIFAKKMIKEITC